MPRLGGFGTLSLFTCLNVSILKDTTLNPTRIGLRVLQTRWLNVHQKYFCTVVIT